MQGPMLCAAATRFGTRHGDGQMETREKILNGAAALVLGSAAVIAACEHWMLRGLKFDDAWIHLRYARNLAEGKGFVYNAGEKVLGSAGVLWELALAAISRPISIDALPAAVSVLNYILLLGCAAAVVRALEAVVPRWFSLITAAALLAYGPLLVSSIGGMETTFLCLFYFLAFLALAQRMFPLACFAAGAASCVRVESFGLMAAVLLAAWLHGRKDFGKSLLALLAVPVPVFGWTWWYFGSPLANSTIAKKTVYIVGPRDATRWCVDGLFQVIPLNRVFSFGPVSPGIADVLGLAAFLALCALGFRALRSASPAASLVSIQAAAPFLFYSIAGPLMFSWYACTFVPIATVLAFLGFYELSRITARHRRGLADALALTLVVSFAITPLKDMWPSMRSPESPAFSFWAPNARENSRTYQYANVARWLNERAGKDDRVCISEIGAFGYFYRGRILDGLGLVSPEALQFHPVPLSMRPSGYYGVIAPGVVKAFRPEFVVSLDVFAGALFGDPWFLQNYVEIGRWGWYGGPAHWRNLPAQMWGASEVRAYRRR